MLNRQMKLAADSGARYIVTVQADGGIRVRDGKSGLEQEVSKEKLDEFIKSLPPALPS
jgi:hypothetical protein